MADDWFDRLYTGPGATAIETETETRQVSAPRVPPPGETIDITKPTETETGETPKTEAPTETGRDPGTAETSTGRDRDNNAPTETETTPAWWRAGLDRIRPYATVAGLGLAVVPTWTGYSAAATWAACVYYGRETAGTHIGYGLAAAGLAAAAIAVHRARSLPGVIASRAVLGCAVVGATSAIHWWDPIELLTGVAW